MSNVDLPAAEFGYPGPLRDRLIAVNDTSLVILERLRLLEP